MKHSVIKRLFVVLLSVTLLLTACAVTIPLEEGRGSEIGRVSDRPHGLSAEELSALQSDPQVSVDPAIVLPEERETTLELVTTFKTGEDGLFYIGSNDGGVSIPVDHRVDENGVLYTSNGKSVTRTSDGKRVRGQHGRNTAACGSDLLVKEDLFYILYSDGFVEVFSMDDESVYTLYDLSDVADFFKLEPDGNVRYTELRVSSDGEVIVIAVSKAGRLYYRLDGTQLTTKETAKEFLTVQEQGENKLLSVGAVSLPSALYALEKEQTPAVIGVSDGVVCVSAGKSHEHENYLVNGTKTEETYDFYDSVTGDLSRVFIRQDWGMTSASCYIPARDGDPLTEYYPSSIYVSGKVFSGLAGSDVVYGIDGNLYVVLYYEQNAEMYRVIPGFTAEQFPERCEICEGVLSSEKNEMAAEKDLSATASTSSTGSHAKTTRSDAISRAKAMCELKWTVTDANKTHKKRLHGSS